MENPRRVCSSFRWSRKSFPSAQAPSVTKTIQYQRREPICKGSGDIICMLDESGSTEDAAPWCKAVALALLDIAIQGKRRFAMIHFSSAGRFQTDLFLPGEFDRENVLKAAETFLDGNTDF